MPGFITNMANWFFKNDNGVYTPYFDFDYTIMIMIFFLLISNTFKNKFLKGTIHFIMYLLVIYTLSSKNQITRYLFIPSVLILIIVTIVLILLAPNEIQLMTNTDEVNDKKTKKKNEGYKYK